MNSGTKIYYTGDRSNESGVGTVTRLWDSDFYGTMAEITLADGRVMQAIVDIEIGKDRRFQVNE